jgi:hypothetical protein
MNRFSLYVLLILVFLGLSKSFAPSVQKSIFIPNERVLPALIQEAPVTFILTDLFDAGFIIKTYYLKLKVVYGFMPAKTIIVRTNKDFWIKCKSNLGMSLFRRFEKDLKESITPMPPGSIFVGNQAFGRWIYEDSGRKIWSFYKVYRHFVKSFGWGSYRPNYTFYKKAKTHEENQTAFFGLENEFGTNGKISQTAFLSTIKRDIHEQKPLFTYMAQYFQLPKWSQEQKR